MGYCTPKQVEDIIANSLTTSTDNPVLNGQPIQLIKVGTNYRKNLLPTDLVHQYINWADEEINAAISELYAVPLCENSDLELSLLSNIDEYNDIIQLDKAYALNPGNVLVFIDGSLEERHVVNEVVNTYTIELDDVLTGTFTSSTTRVLRVKYPDAINLVCSRLAAANLYDKYFAAQANPNVSDYGKNLRIMAIRDLNNILNGRTILHGQRKIGNRFFNSNLKDRYGLPGIEGSDGSRNIEQQ